jgi:hypothetical protein
MVIPTRSWKKLGPFPGRIIFIWHVRQPPKGLLKLPKSKLEPGPSILLYEITLGKAFFFSAFFKTSFI